ncbi:lysozyme inhibitor LprI family protein [Methyloglobulus sp.]|uniref:lysozyme inhibitor LprI family protein n=1 Tax=Methyloglobulus sp. TaxID=2518622 RepID=UPI0039896D5F
MSINLHLINGQDQYDLMRFRIIAQLEGRGKPMGRNFRLILAGWFFFFASSTVNAASFDCTKAATHVEKLICSNSEISELDNEVNADYHKALDETNNELRTGLIKQQKHWLKFMRNRCKDELCLKHAYWSKLAELKIFFFMNNPNVYGLAYTKSPYKNEAEKLEPIKQILTTTNFRIGDEYDPLACKQIFNDLKQMKNISFLESKVKTDSYEDAALDPWKQYCKSGQSLNFVRVCDPKFNTDRPEAELDKWCAVIYGEQPFKVFEIPTQAKKKKHYILYMGSASGAMNTKPRRGGFRSEYVAGFHELDVANCKVTKHWNAPITEPSHYNSIIKYKDDYYFLVLEPSSTSVNYFLSIGSIDSEDKSCRWYPVINNTTTNSGEK